MLKSALGLCCIVFVVSACGGDNKPTKNKTADEICNNGLDDNFNTLVDCVDPTCAGTDDCEVTVCGDNAIGGSEACDGTNLDGTTCEDLGFDGGTLGCNTNCSGFDTADCTGSPSTCGDATKDSGEICDGTDLDGETCLTQGFDGGTLRCNSSCTGFNTSLCTDGPVTCGNDTLDSGEACDDDQLGGQTCLTQGFSGGTLGCDADCEDFDTSACTGPLACDNDGVLDAGEDCDGTQFGTASCADFGFSGGTLTCTGCVVSASACNDAPPSCGNGWLDVGELCEGDDIGGAEACDDWGLGNGTIGCKTDCTLDFSSCDITDACEARGNYGDGYCDDCEAWGGHADTEDCSLCGVADGECVDYIDLFGSACESTGHSPDPDCPVCGDDVADFETEELCDGTDLGGWTCSDLGYDGGELGCSNACNGFDTTGCFVCGDRRVTGLETCDGDVWASGEQPTCADYGLGDAGDLVGCNNDCTPDFSECAETDLCAAHDPSWYGDGWCDLCQLWGGEVDSDCVDTCGNGIVEDSELCDDGDFGDYTTCDAYGFAGGDALGCNDDCTPNFEACTLTTCGDGDIEGYEDCEGTDVDGATCEDIGMKGGDKLTCKTDCSFNTSACTATVCGDDAAEGFEECDDTDLRDFTCEDFGFSGGTLGCDAKCGFDVSDCELTTCGNGAIDDEERCDGTNVDGLTCASFGLQGGTLGCASDCTNFDFSDCSSCGDGRVTGYELCDPGATASLSDDVWGSFDGPDCRDFGFDTFGFAEVACGDDCTAETSDFSECGFDTDLCEINGWYEDGICDACDLLGGSNDPDCQDLCGGGDICAEYFDSWSGVWTCFTPDPDCFDTCGDGEVDLYEWCEVGDLDGWTCEDYGFDDGELDCFGDCTFDFSGCFND